MDNNKRLETIIKIREIREKLDMFSFSKEEKEVLRQSLNLYEEELDFDIARANNEIKELQKEGITSSNNEVTIPIEISDSRYKEYANLRNINIIDIITNIFNMIDTKDDISLEYKQTILMALKRFSVYLEELELKRQNNQMEFLEKENSK